MLNDALLHHTVYDACMEASYSGVAGESCSGGEHVRSGEENGKSRDDLI